MMAVFAETFASRRKGLSVVAGTLVGIPVALFAALRALPRLDVYFESANFHLIVVSAIAACAAGMAILAGIAAARSREAPLVFLALGCVAVGVGMLGHGLTTPGVAGIGMNFWVGRLPTIAIAAFAGFQAAAVLRPRRAVARFVAARPWTCLALPTVMMLGTIVWILVDPLRGFGSRPVPAEDTLQNLLKLASISVLIVVGVIHWRRWRFNGDMVQLALVLASLLAAEAIGSMHFGRFWHLSWWDYHVLLLVGFGSTVYAVIVGYLRSQGRRDGLAHVFRRGTLHHISRGYPEALTALAAAVEARDAYTRGHSQRVTEVSLAIGQQLGLGSDKLRQLVWGAELHDIGKIGIPDYIIQKEGPLTAEERSLVEQHPAIGWEIARQASSLGEVLDVVRHHHERVDGNGYPDKLAGNDIPRAARIVAVADVWDALTSNRSYRPAWSRDRALEIMVEGRGSQFDAECLDAFLDILDSLDNVGPGTPERAAGGGSPQPRRSAEMTAAHHEGPERDLI
jgi:putative nucleotidyltransferase with HDIG domain